MKNLVFLFIPILFLCSCSASHLQQRTSTVRVTYILDGPELISVSKGRACVLLAQTNTGQEQYSKTASNSLARVLRNNGFEVLSFPELVNELNEKDIYYLYYMAHSFYKENGMLRKPELQFIGKKLGLDYFVMPLILDVRRWEAGRFSILGFKVLTTHKVCIVAAMEIWSKDATIVFSVTSDISLANERIKENPISVEAAFDQVWLSILQYFEKNAGP